MISTGRASSMESARRDGIGLGVGAALGEADGRSERLDRDCEELLRLGILKGRPGGRLGLDLDAEGAALEVFASQVLRHSERRVTEGSSPFLGAITISATAQFHQAAPPRRLWMVVHRVLDV